jgi:hypothetical protein
MKRPTGAHLVMIGAISAPAGEIFYKVEQKIAKKR